MLLDLKIVAAAILLRWGRLVRPMSLSFPTNAQFVVGRSPWTAADALVGLLGLGEAHFVMEERVQGDPRRPGGLPHDCA